MADIKSRVDKVHSEAIKLRNELSRKLGAVAYLSKRVPVTAVDLMVQDLHVELLRINLDLQRIFLGLAQLELEVAADAQFEE